MPAKKQITREMILDAALRILRQDGWAAISVKSLAGELQCSTQPLYLSFSGMENLRNLIFPLFVEQFLLMLVSIADTFVVSFASEADVSGVSLVTSFNTVLIFLFTALSAGGAVIISQYIGRQEQGHAAGALL